MKIWRCNHTQAFTLVEAVVCAAAVLVLSGIVVHRVREQASPQAGGPNQSHDEPSPG